MPEKQPNRRKLPSIDPSTGEKRKRGRPRKVVENGSQNAGGAASKGKKRGRPRKSETAASKREAAAGSEAEGEWRVDPLSTPSYAPRNVAQNGAGNGYGTNKSKGPILSPEDLILVDSDDTDEEGVAGGIMPPAITYDLDEDTADVAAVAAAVAAKATEAGGGVLGGSAATPARSDRNSRPAKDSTLSPASGSGGPSLEWNGLV